MKTRLRISLKTAIRNIEAVAARAQPEDWTSGREWYWEARDWAGRMAYHYGVHIRLVCHITAALSPGVRWETNKEAAEQILAGESYIKGGYRKNAKRAAEILETYYWEERDGKQPHDCYQILSGPKVTAFAETIFNPDSNQSDVVLDFHAIGIALGKRFTAKTAPDLRKKEREILDAAYRKVAESYGVRPHQIQAVTWTRWRKEKK